LHGKLLAAVQGAGVQRQNHNHQRSFQNLSPRAAARAPQTIAVRIVLSAKLVRLVIPRKFMPARAPSPAPTTAPNTKRIPRSPGRTGKACLFESGLGSEPG
jgi:hypothetical protein